MLSSRNQPCHCGSGKKYKKCCHDQDREKNDPEFLLRHASEYPVTQCFIREEWEDDGLANILICRKNPETDHFLLAMFLVDTYCLGVKNVLMQGNVAPAMVAHLVATHPYPMIEVEYEYCRGLILGAIDYARKLGFEPHPDFQHAQEFIEPQKPYKTDHTFGKDGKPFFIFGPDDDIDDILQKLQATRKSWDAKPKEPKNFLHQLRTFFSKKPEV